MGGIQGVQDLGVFRVIGQPNLNYIVDRAGRCSFRHQCQRCAGCHSDRGRRRRRQPGVAGRSALRPGGPLPEALSRYAGSDRRHSPAFALRRTSLAGATDPGAKWRMAPRRSTAKRTSATSPSNTASAAAIWAARWKKPSPRSTHRSSFPPATTSTGRANTRARSAPTSA